MFGSNFAQQFGLFGPPWDTLNGNSQGGIFGPDAPIGGATPGTQPLPDVSSAQPVPPTMPQGGSPPPVAGAPGIVPPGQQPTPPPLGGGQPAAGGDSAAALAPGPLAAGVKSEFGRTPF